MWQQMPTDGSCRSEATAVRITSNPVKRVVRRACQISLALKLPLITSGPLTVSEICGGRCSPRRAVHNAPSHHAPFSNGPFSSTARRDCRRTACNFALNKGLTRLRTAGRRFVPFRWHFIVSTLLCPSLPIANLFRCEKSYYNVWNVPSYSSSTNSPIDLDRTKRINFKWFQT